MNLRSKRKTRPQQITKYFTIKHIDTPNFGSLKYHPKQKLITGFTEENSLVWKLVDDQVYENNRVNDQLALKKLSFREVSIIESTNSIVKQDYLNIQIFDYKTLQQRFTLSPNIVKYGNIQLTENVHQNQIIFLTERKCFIIAKLQNFKTIRTIFDPQTYRFVDQQKCNLIQIRFLDNIVLLRDQMRKHQPQQITNYFNIKHIDIPMIEQLRYYPKFKLITGFYQLQAFVWKLIDDQVYENNYLNHKLALKGNFVTRKVSIIESNNIIVKQGYSNFQMFDYNSLQKNYMLVWNRGVIYSFSYVTENVDFKQMIFLNESKCFIIAKLWIQVENLLQYKEQNKISKKLQESIFHSRFIQWKNFQHFKYQQQFVSNKINRHRTMKTKACIYNEDSCLQSLFINKLGLFIVLYVKSLDMFDSQTFQLLGSEQLPNNKLNHKITFQMAFDGSQILIFYQTKRKFKALEQIDQQD